MPKQNSECLIIDGRTSRKFTLPKQAIYGIHGDAEIQVIELK